MFRYDFDTVIQKREDSLLVVNFSWVAHALVVEPSTQYVQIDTIISVPCSS